MITGDPISVLVVDDDPGFRASARTIIEGQGLRVVAEASTVAEALGAARDVRPDGALVDVGLPDGDGVALARTLAGQPWRPRVLLTSSDPDAVEDDDVRWDGAAGFLPKQDLPDASLSRLLSRE